MSSTSPATVWRLAMTNIDDPKPLNLVAAPDLTVPRQSINNVLRYGGYGTSEKPESARARRRRMEREARRG